MDPVDLDRLLDQELKELPGPRAPGSLLPRVLAATVHAAPQPQPQTVTGWSTWPRSWQVGFVAVLLAITVGVSMLFAAPPAPVTSATRAVGETATVVRVLWDVLLQPVATYMFVLALALALACAAAWAGLEMALGGVSHR